jgi:hypothetical protein
MSLRKFLADWLSAEKHRQSAKFPLPDVCTVICKLALYAASPDVRGLRT